MDQPGTQQGHAPATTESRAPRLLVVHTPPDRGLVRRLFGALAGRLSGEPMELTVEPPPLYRFERSLQSADFVAFLVPDPEEPPPDLMLRLGLALARLGRSRVLALLHARPRGHAPLWLEEVHHHDVPGGNDAAASQLARDIIRRLEPLTPAVAERLPPPERLVQAGGPAANVDHRVARIRRDLASIEDVLPTDFVHQPGSAHALTYWTRRGPHHLLRLTFTDARLADGAHALSSVNDARIRFRPAPEAGGDGRWLQFEFFDPARAEAPLLRLLAKDLDVIEIGLT